MPDAGPPRPGRAFLRGALLAAVAVVAVEAYGILLGDNVRTVLPGRLYRSATVKPERLARLIRDRGIRTVLNLRGTAPEQEWYLAEARATAAAGVSQEDVCWSASRLPPPAELRELIGVLEQADYPLLIHCQRGVDRTGLACAIALLLTTDADLSTARRELSLTHGHVPLAGTEAMDQFLDFYDQWLQGWHVDHSPPAFRHWALCEYCPGPCRGRVELLDEPTAPAHATAGLRVRAHNESRQTWELRPGTQAGVHVRYVVVSSAGLALLDRAGQFRATVPPGGSVDLTLAVPPLPPGRYCLAAELVNGRDCSFTQVGSGPHVWELYVRE